MGLAIKSYVWIYLPNNFARTFIILSAFSLFLPSSFLPFIFIFLNNICWVSYDSGQTFTSISFIKCDESICCTDTILVMRLIWDNRYECSLKVFQEATKLIISATLWAFQEQNHSGWLSYIIFYFIPLLNCSIKQSILEVLHLFKHRVIYLDEKICLKS